MSEIYLYDGSLEGALSGIYTLFKEKKPMDSIELLSETPTQIGFLEHFFELETDENHAGKVMKWIYEAFGDEALQRILTAYLSDDKAFGTCLYRALKKAHRMNHADALTNYKDPDIMALYTLYRKVVRAEHLILGILRFKELDTGVFYAYFEPEYNLLPLICNHFKERLGDQTWVIHDGIRHQAAFYDGNSVFINDLEPYRTIQLSERETLFQEYWKGYFKHIAIKERINPRCQRSFMPKKYWKFLVEDPQGTREKLGTSGNT